MVLINSTEFGSISIDGKNYQYDVLVSWNGKVEKLELTVRHLFGIPELNLILSKNPDSLIIGKGQSGYLSVSDDVKKFCKEKNIEFIDLVSKQAVKKFNDYIKKNRKVVAFIHVTC